MALSFMKGNIMQEMNNNHIHENKETAMFSKTIGRTTYDVSVYHDNANQETMYSKVLRLMKNDLSQEQL
jgi:hypothetical protein